MADERYVALLRGINVGGRRPVAMADLRTAFAAHGQRAVRTYIQSGNVVFASDAHADTLEADLEAMLGRTFGHDITVVVRAHEQMRAIVGGAPAGFGERPKTQHSDVIFLKPPLTSSAAIRVLQPREGVDRAWPGPGVLYVQRLSERRAQSGLTRITAAPEYRLMTIRNWRTTTKLLSLLDDG